VVRSMASKDATAAMGGGSGRSSDISKQANMGLQGSMRQALVDFRLKSLDVTAKAVALWIVHEPIKLQSAIPVRVVRRALKPGVWAHSTSDHQHR